MKLGFGELIIIILVALFFIKPDQVPVYAKKAGRMLRQLREYTNQASKEVKDTIAEPMKEMQEAIAPVTEIAQDVKKSLDPLNDIKKDMESALDPVNQIKRDIDKDLRATTAGLQSSINSIGAAPAPAQEPEIAEAVLLEEPAEAVPVEAVPVEEVPAQEAPAEAVPVEEAPAEEAPAEVAPTKAAPAKEAPAAQTGEPVKA